MTVKLYSYVCIIIIVLSYPNKPSRLVLIKHSLQPISWSSCLHTEVHEEYNYLQRKQQKNKNEELAVCNSSLLSRVWISACKYRTNLLLEYSDAAIYVSGSLRSTLKA